MAKHVASCNLAYYSYYKCSICQGSWCSPFLILNLPFNSTNPLACSSWCNIKSTHYVYYNNNIGTLIVNSSIIARWQVQQEENQWVPLCYSLKILKEKWKRGGRGKGGYKSLHSLLLILYIFPEVHITILNRQLF